ncbi:energy transducer TonB [Saccharicrinis sp. FJH2]|uniref:energy transducer TonB n=1 Tax=Saccharicrinis sp. FJH65 TaxID=3344659 RepID=UPI0035F42A9F
MKKIVSLCCFLLIYNLNAQNFIPNYEIGNYMLSDGRILNGYYDFTIETEEALTVTYSFGENYTPGCVYNLKNEKLNGSIKYTGNQGVIKFKEKEKAYRISPEECKGYVIGTDSFTVIGNFKINNTRGINELHGKSFAQVIDKIGEMRFYMYVSDDYYYLVQKKQNSEILSFPEKKKKFYPFIDELFDSYPALCKMLKEKKPRDWDMGSIIKMYKYWTTYNTGSKVFFNAFWDEVEENKPYYYYAKVDSVNGTEFHLSYYMKNGVKLYNGNYTSFYPNIKSGDFNFYYPNGNLRKTVTFIDNKPAKETEFYANGVIHRIGMYMNLEFLSLKERKIKYKGIIADKEKIFGDLAFSKQSVKPRIIQSKSKTGIMYYTVNDETGKSLLNSEGNGTEYIYDAISGRNLIYEYKNYRPFVVYYENSGSERIYQITSENISSLRLTPLLKNITQNFDYPESCIKNNMHGTVLVRCLVEPNGKVSEYNIIKGIGPLISSQLENLLSIYKMDELCDPGKVDGEKVTQEVILSLEFNLNGFTGYRQNNNFYMNPTMFYHYTPPIQYQPKFSGPF